MEDLRHVMKVIDENSHKLSEGDYLTLCNLLRKIYNHKEREEWTTLVDYEMFDVYSHGEQDEVLDHFHDHFYNVSISNEESYLQMQVSYLEDELIQNRPIKRTTKYVKYNAIREYCQMNNVQIRKYDEEHLRAYLTDHHFEIGDVGTSFENAYRALYSEAIKKRIQKLYSWLVSLDDM